MPLTTNEATLSAGLPPVIEPYNLREELIREGIQYNSQENRLNGGIDGARYEADELINQLLEMNTTQTPLDYDQRAVVAEDIARHIKLGTAKCRPEIAMRIYNLVSERKLAHLVAEGRLTQAQAEAISAQGKAIFDGVTGTPALVDLGSRISDGALVRHRGRDGKRRLSPGSRLLAFRGDVLMRLEDMFNAPKFAVSTMKVQSVLMGI